MNTNTSPNQASPRKWSTLAFYIVILAILFVAAKRFQSDRDALNEKMEQLTEQNQTLQKTLTAAQEALTSAQEQIDQLNSGDSSPTTKQRLDEVRETRITEPAASEIETLFLQEPFIEQSAEGLLVRLEYKPEDGAALPDSTTIAFRVPSAGTARILSLTATGASSTAIINPGKTLAMIECSPAKIGALGFELKVSGPGTAIVRGSEGIIDFEIDIAPDGCTVRRL